MALRFVDSFDHYATADILSKWDGVTGGVISANGRNGTSCYDSNGSSNRPIIKILDSQATWIVGCAFKPNNFPGASYEVIRLADGGTTQLTIAVNNAHKLVAIRGDANGGTTLGTGTTVLAANVYVYVEVKATINDTTGTVAVKLNGSVTEINLSSQDTKVSSNASADRIVFFGDSFGGVVTTNYLDDVYMCDGTGSSPSNDFLGDCRVQALFPSGNGNSSQLINSNGNSTNNYSYVDETTPNGDTDYVESSTVSDKDTYAFGDLTPTAGTVYGVQPLLYAKKTDAGSRSIVSVARLSSTEVDSSNQALASSYRYYMDIRETKPGGGSWSISDVNSAEFGVKITA